MTQYFAKKLNQEPQQIWQDNQKLRQHLSGRLSHSKTGSIDYKQGVKNHLDTKLPTR